MLLNESVQGGWKVFPRCLPLTFYNQNWEKPNYFLLFLYYFLRIFFWCIFYLHSMFLWSPVFIFYLLPNWQQMQKSHQRINLFWDSNSTEDYQVVERCRKLWCKKKTQADHRMSLPQKFVTLSRREISEMMV